MFRTIDLCSFSSLCWPHCTAFLTPWVDVIFLGKTGESDKSLCTRPTLNPTVGLCLGLEILLGISDLHCIKGNMESNNE